MRHRITGRLVQATRRRVTKG